MGVIRITDPGATYERLFTRIQEMEAEIAHAEAKGWTEIVKIRRRRLAALKGRRTHIARRYFGVTP